MLDETRRDYFNSPVPLDKRRSLIAVALVLIGAPICVAALFGGAALAKGQTFQQGVFSVALGGAILSVIAGLIGTIGVRTGLSTSLLVQRTFGLHGGGFVSIVLALTLVGWYGVQVGFFGKTMQALWPGGGIFTSETVASYWGGILMFSTAYFGFRGLSILSNIAVPLVAALCIWGVARVAGQVDILAYTPPEHMSLAEGTTLVVGAFAVGAVVLPDITRYAKGVWQTWVITVLGFLIAEAFVQLSGMVTSMATGSADLIGAMIALGMSVPALLVLILGQWTTNDNNMYSASLAISGALPKLRKDIVVLVCGLVATICGAHGLADGLIPFLLWLGVLIPPIGGVLIADHLVMGGKCTLGLPTESVRWTSLISWAIGALVGGFVAAGIPAINATGSAFLACLVLARLTRKAHADKPSGGHD